MTPMEILLETVDDEIISGKCALGVLVTHDVFSERIANASSPEAARWELVHSYTIFLCCLMIHTEIQL